MKEQVFYTNNQKIVLKKPKKKLSEILFIIFGLTLPIINVILFWFVVNSKSILMAFQDRIGFDTVWTLKHFKYIFEEVLNPQSTMIEGLKNTMLFFFFDLIIQTGTTYVISFFIYKKIPFANGFRYIFMLPGIISAVAISSCVKFMFSPGGPMPEIWEMIFGVKPLFFADSDYTLKFLLLYQYWLGFGGGILLYVATFARIPQELVEAGRLDGLGYFREMINIVFPLTWPFFSTMLLMKFCGMLGAGGPVLLFTKGSYGTYTLSYWIYELTTGGGTYRGAAVGLVMTAISLPISLVFNWLANKVEPIEY